MEQSAPEQMDQPLYSSESQQAQVDPAAKRKKILTWVKMIIFLCIIAALVVFIIIESEMVGQWLESFLKWVEDNEVLGGFVFILVYIMATILFVPGLILTLGAGFVYSEVYGPALGVFVATLIVFIGATIGSILAMLLGRYVFRESLSEKIKKYPKFVAIEEAIKEEGTKLTLLLRLSPLIPFNAFNYFMGITSVKFPSYCIGSFGMLPGTLAYCYFGSALSSISDAASGEADGGALQLSLLIVGSVLAIIAVCYVSYIAKKKINSMIEQNQQSEVQPSEEQENAGSGEQENGEELTQSISNFQFDIQYQIEIQCSLNILIK